MADRTPGPDEGPAREATVSTNVRQLRETAGLTQKELAARAGLGEMAICTIENGKRRINVDDLYILARALDATTRQLLTPGGAEADVQQYEILFEGGIAKQVTADSVEWNDIWVHFLLLGELVYKAAAPRILGICTTQEAS